MTRLLLDQEQVGRRLRPHQNLVVDVVLDSWKSWMEHGRTRPEVHLGLCERTRATYVHDEFVRLARRQFHELGVSSFTHKEVFFLDFGAGLVVRHKKLDRQGKPCNYPTENALGMSNQPWLIPKAKPIVDKTVVVVGYQIDADALQIERIKILCMSGNSVDWSYRIYNSDEVAARFGVEPVHAIVSLEKRSRKVRVKERKRQKKTRRA